MLFLRAILYRRAYAVGHVENMDADFVHTYAWGQPGHKAGICNYSMIQNDLEHRSLDVTR